MRPRACTTYNGGKAVTERDFPEKDLPQNDESKQESTTSSVPVTEERTHAEESKKEGSYLTRFWRWFCGKNPDGSKQAAVTETKKRTILRYTASALAFLAVAGLAAMAFEIPKIVEEGGVRISWLENLFDGDRTEEERNYDHSATHESAFAYRVQEDGTVEICGYLGIDVDVVLPRIIDGKTVTAIGNSAFAKEDIRSIAMYNTVTKIDDNAFYGCKYLTGAVLSEGLTELGENAFYDCESLTEIVLPGGLTEIQKNTFRRCLRLKEVTLGKSLTKIGPYAFAQSGITTISFPESLTETKQGAFLSCASLMTVDFSEGLQIIGTETFSDCTSLTSVNLPDSLRILEDRAFSRCVGLTGFSGGKNVETVGIGCFEDAIMTTGSTVQIILGDGILVKYFGNETAVAVKNDVKIIWDGAFEGNPSIAMVQIPSSVTTVSDRAFRDCLALSSVLLPNSVTHIGKEAFAGCISLSGIIIPSELRTMGESAFANCSSLKGISLPASLTEIPTNAFARCSDLIDLTFNNQTVIGAGSFANCARLEWITIPASVKAIGANAFSGCTMLYSVSLRPGLVSLGSSAFSATALKTISLPATLNEIGENVFEDCSKLYAVYTTKGTYADAWATNRGY